MPSAIAPDDTSTTSRPPRFSAAISSAQRATAAWSRPRPSLVTRLEPTLTTSALARRDDRASWRRSCAPATRLRARRRVRRRGATGRRCRDSATGASSSRRHRAAPAARDARRASPGSRTSSARQPSPLIAAIANTGPFQRYDFTNAVDARLALVLGNEVELVQHEPARLLVQRLVVLRKLLDDRARVAHRIGVSDRAARCRRCAAAGACAAGGAGSDGRAPRLRPRLR